MVVLSSAVCCSIFKPFKAVLGLTLERFWKLCGCWFVEEKPRSYHADFVQIFKPGEKGGAGGLADS